MRIRGSWWGPSGVVNPWEMDDKNQVLPVVAFGVVVYK